MFEITGCPPISLFLVRFVEVDYLCARLLVVCVIGFFLVEVECIGQFLFALRNQREAVLDVLDGVVG